MTSATRLALLLWFPWWEGRALAARVSLGPGLAFGAGVTSAFWLASTSWVTPDTLTRSLVLVVSFIMARFFSVVYSIPVANFSSCTSIPTSLASKRETFILL